jgi:hypothetical protein
MHPLTRLRAARIVQQRTVRDIACGSNISESYAKALETGMVTHCSDAVARRLGKYLKLDPAQLFDRTRLVMEDAA